MYKLYTFARSSTAWRARIALNLKKITPEYAYVHLFKGEQKKEAYQKVNPNMVHISIARACLLWSCLMERFSSNRWP